LCGSVVGLDRNAIGLEIASAPSAVEPAGCPEPPGDSRQIVTIEASDVRWRPIP